VFCLLFETFESIPQGLSELGTSHDYQLLEGIFLVPIDAILLFELWILIPRTISLGPAVPPCFSGNGFSSHKLLLLGPAVPSCLLSYGF
jgi:hypothetical protein